MQRIFYSHGGAVWKGGFIGGSGSNKFGGLFSDTFKSVSKTFSGWSPLVWFVLFSLLPTLRHLRIYLNVGCKEYGLSSQGVLCSDGALSFTTHRALEQLPFHCGQLASP